MQRRSLTGHTDMKRDSTKIEKQVFEFLNDLRESGATNMFGSRPYVMAEFPKLKQNEAQKLISLWMANFNIEGDYSQIEDKELIL